MDHDARSKMILRELTKMPDAMVSFINRNIKYIKVAKEASYVRESAKHLTQKIQSGLEFSNIIKSFNVLCFHLIKLASYVPWKSEFSSLMTSLIALLYELIYLKYNKVPNFDHVNIKTELELARQSVMINLGNTTYSHLIKDIFDCIDTGIKSIVVPTYNNPNMSDNRFAKTVVAFNEWMKFNINSENGMLVSRVVNYIARRYFIFGNIGGCYMAPIDVHLSVPRSIDMKMSCLSATSFFTVAESIVPNIFSGMDQNLINTVYVHDNIIVPNGRVINFQ